ncbi:MAG TPA: MBL fold metallo-hydrolase [Acidobacteriota bacterium]|nr:MBL fold metallo-hydrolase [Acidobacteriota bacterium]
MRAVAPGTSLIDVRFRGRPEYLGCYVIEAGNGVALVDPGPTSTLAALEDGLRLGGLSVDNVTSILLTHIHLDHAGATGTLLARNPDIRVYVHRHGARHMIDPQRLLASAERLYGEVMDEMWGEFLGVPEANVEALDGGQTIELGGREMLVEHTPGHAKHHVGYFDTSTGVAYVGDTLGVRIDNRPHVLPATPPPDVDLEGWEESTAKIRAWKPTLLCLTHFGPARPVTQHIDEHERRLDEWAAIVRADLGSGMDDDEMHVARFCRHARREIESALLGSDAEVYLNEGLVGDSWRGLARYFRKLAVDSRKPGAKDS